MAESTPSTTPVTPSPTKPAADPRFEYQDIGPSAISVAMWDRIAASVFDPSTGWMALIKSSVMATFAALYVIVRDRLIAQQKEYEKQQYARQQAGKNQDDLDRDNLAGEKRP